MTWKIIESGIKMINIDGKNYKFDSETGEVLDYNGRPRVRLDILLKFNPYLEIKDGDES